ncbi:MAG: PD-(D/E)XK nuclease family protein [Candidatus Babeliales bacterium]
MDKIIPIRLSHSSLQTLNTCERKFQLDKLLVTDVQREETEHTSFGKAYGAGVASYLVHQDPDLALYQAWLNYYPQIETDKKNQSICFSALERSFPKLDSILDEHEVMVYNGKPAVELSFRLNINEHFYFVGHIDVVLKNRYSGVCTVVDAKSTGLALLDLDPLYKNSGQTIGYSIALDRIVGEELSTYGVGYLVAQLGKTPFEAKIHTLFYQKTLMDRLQWFISLGLDVRRLELMRDLNSYPMRGDSCLNFMRPCKYFGVCGLKSGDVVKKQEEDPIVYDFVYDLDDLINEHLKRINS